MRLFTIISAILMSLILLTNESLTASVDFAIYPNGSVLGPAMDFTDINDAEAQIKEHPERLIDNNEKVIPYGLALANTIGYPNGKSIIPNFEAGFALGAAAYKYDRYENFSKDDPNVPGIGANAAVHFGFGLSPETDITLKMIVNQGMYSPEKSISKETVNRLYDFKLEETNLISFGVKGRYNLIGKTDIVPLVFSFGGITAGVALDFIHGKVSSSGTYRDTRTLEFTGVDSFSGDSFTQNIDIETTVDGRTSLEWNIVSLTPEVMVYADFFYLFSFYTGPALTLNAGSANLNMTANGVLKNLTPVYADDGHIVELAGVNNTIATGVLNVNAPLDVPIAVPLWKLGLEINLGPFKLQMEGAAILTSPTNSFIAQVGARVQF